MNNLQNIIAGFVAQTQDDEDMLQEFFIKRYLATAEGAQLDGLGQIIGINRGSLNDTDYRTRLYLRISQNFSEGTIENVIWIFKELMAADSVELSEVYPAEFSMLAINPTPIADLMTIYNAVFLAKAAGVGIGFLGHTTDSPFFAFLDDTDPLTDSFGDIFDLDIGGFFVSTFLNPPIVSPDLGILYREVFAYASGMNMLTQGFSWSQFGGEVGTFLVNAGEQGEIGVTSGNWAGGFTLDAGEVWSDYDFYVNVVSFGNRVLLGFRFTAAGGYWLQWVSSLELVLMRGPKNYPSGNVVIGNYNALSPASVNQWRIRVVGNSIKVYADNVLLFEHFDSTHLIGTIGFSNYQATPLVVGKFLVIDRA